MPGPPLVVTGAALLSLYWTLQSQGAINRFGLFIGGAVTFNQSLADQVGTAVKGAFTTHLAPLMSTTTALQKVGIRSINFADLPEFRDTSVAAIGSGTGDPLPRATASCITMRTDKAGKKFTGRIYLGGWTEGQNDTGANSLAAVGTAGVAFVNAVNGSLLSLNLRLAIVSRPSYATTIVKTTLVPGQDPIIQTISQQNARPGFVTEVKAVESRTANWESQRRRDNGKGGVVSFLGPIAAVSINQ